MEGYIFWCPHRDPYSILYYSILNNLCDLFYFLEDLNIASYADDTTIYTVNERKESVISALETSSSLHFGWFNNNFMKANSDKIRLIMSCTKATTAMIDGLPIDSSKTEFLLGTTIDHELKFDDHVNYLCKKTSLKLNALARVAHFMNVSNKRIIMKSFIESQFGYCPLIWMLHSRGLNYKINCIHERALRITHNDNYHQTENYSLKIDL